MAEGRVIRAISGFFDVYDQGHTRRCRARGVFKKQGTTVLVGDEVAYDPIGSHEGVVTSVQPRRTELVRPPIANVNQVLVVFSFVTPNLNLLMLDKTLVAVQIAGVKPVIVLTKSDLTESTIVSATVDMYRRSGFTVLPIATKAGIGIEEVRNVMKGSVNVVAGPSGAGKSTLANALLPGLNLEMGDVSEKIGRGKQTTRHTELFMVDDATWLADAPGFSQLQLGVESRALKTFFSEFYEDELTCPYRGCVHIEEENCAVKSAVEEGKIARSRYESYVQLYGEIKDREEHMY